MRNNNTGSIYKFTLCVDDCNNHEEGPFTDKIEERYPMSICHHTDNTITKVTANKRIVSVRYDVMGH